MATRNLTTALILFLAASPLLADEWQDACRLIEEFGVTCEGVAPPPVVEAEFTDQKRDKIVDEVVRFGGIFIRASLPEGTDRSAVIVHAMVHYILDEKDLVALNETRDLTCQSEGYAYAVSNRFLAEQKRRDLVKDAWWRRYPGCKRSHSQTPVLTASR